MPPKLWEQSRHGTGPGKKLTRPRGTGRMCSGSGAQVCLGRVHARSWQHGNREHLHTPARRTAPVASPSVEDSCVRTHPESHPAWHSFTPASREAHPVVAHPHLKILTQPEAHISRDIHTPAATHCCIPQHSYALTRCTSVHTPRHSCTPDCSPAHTHVHTPQKTHAFMHHGTLTQKHTHTL